MITELPYIVSGPACTTIPLFAAGISPLDHEVRNHPVPEETVVESLLDELDEAGDMNWRLGGMTTDLVLFLLR